MLEAMTTLILVIVGAMLIIFVLGYGIFITFYPLSKTIKGGIDAMKEHPGEKKGAEKKQKARTYTDGARSVRKEEPRGTKKKDHKPKQ
jgi:hypothetical protein